LCKTAAVPPLRKLRAEVRAVPRADDVPWHAHCTRRKSDMALPDRFPEPAIDVLVALSLMHLGSNTRAARIFHEMVRDDAGIQGEGWRLLDRVAEAIGLPRSERSWRIADARRAASEALAAANAQGLAVVSSFHPRYPKVLRDIPDPPIVLWIRGGIEPFAARAVAIVGSRNATPAGLVVARRLSGELARAGVVVVSGLARGIDAAAHRGALDGGGPTVAVLGNGVDVSYPAENRQLSAAVAANGALVSEFPPGSRPYPSHFPLRNRIISGLCQGVLVVEASARSGSLITANAALEQGRQVFAVPGSVPSGRYSGCHALIKDGARLVETVDDIQEELGWADPGRRTQAAEASNRRVSNSLVDCMRSGDPISADELAARTGRGAADCLAELGVLEVAGLVARTPGGTFVKVDEPATYIEGNPIGRT
jgi:DNA processing protein